jgi:adenylosuccinate synthase
MPAIVVVGAQWGDEGKGKVVDRLAHGAHWVARFQGGNNAGHTLVVDGQKRVLHLLPSGVLHGHVRCAIGSGAVVDPDVLLEELAALAKAGLGLGPERLRVDGNAPVLLPWHRTLDRLRERNLGEAKIGTTGRGIGPCYEDAVGRRAVTVRDLTDPARLRRAVARGIESLAGQIASLGGEVPTVAGVVKQAEPWGRALAEFVDDVGARLDEALRQGQRVLLEGAQGTLLDVRHGTWPFVTSSHTVAGAACTGTGLGPTRIDKVLGVTKAYCTRVGSGPFPTELQDATGAAIAERGQEFGATTGRPRRVGWLDLVALRYAARVNGLSGLFFNKIDVLSGHERIGVCVNYQRDGLPIEEFPSQAEDMAGVEPRYEWLPGWREDLRGCRQRSDLPVAAREFVERVEALSGLPCDTISVGPGREETVSGGGEWG